MADKELSISFSVSNFWSTAFITSSCNKLLQSRLTPALIAAAATCTLLASVLCLDHISFKAKQSVTTWPLNFHSFRRIVCNNVSPVQQGSLLTLLYAHITDSTPASTNFLKAYK